jgi:hypothetical protein
MSRRKQFVILLIVPMGCIFVLAVISEISDPKPRHLISCFLLALAIVCWIASLKKLK